MRPNHHVQKVNSLLGRQKVNSPIKRALLFHTSLVEDIRTKYENAKTNREKQLIAKVLSIRMGFIRHESLHRQGICFGRKMHTINI